MIRPKKRPPRHKMQGGEAPAPVRSGVFTFPSPSDGWVTAGNLQQAPVTAAQRLDNFFPTAQGARLRAGCVKHATLNGAAERLLSYVDGSGSDFFACSETEITEIESPADADTAETPIMTGFISGDWSATQFSNSGGVFMVAVNGRDNAWYWDGTEAQPLVDETVYDLGYDALSSAFTVGQTVTGGSSGASAEIIAIHPTSATAGTLKVGAITGTFSDNETITDGVSGSATSNIPSGTSEASTAAITGVQTKNLSQVWSHKNRLFFVRRNTLKAYYLPVESIGGAASEIDLAPVFSKGGRLVFGCNWSLDAGDGLDDKCVFVTDRGQIAVYAGTNPNSADTWSLEGVYDLGNPIDKHAFFSLGGDVMLVQDDGIFPLSQAITLGYIALFERSLSRPIEDTWQEQIAKRSSADPVTATIWQSRGMLLVSSPEKEGSQPVAYVCNTRYGTWARYVGWDVRCGVVHNDKLYFADNTGKVFQAETGGSDNGTLYTGHYVPKFTDLGSPNLKMINHVCFVCRSPVEVTLAATALRDYENKDLPTPAPTPENTSASVWGTSDWSGSAKWGTGQNLFGQHIWKAIGSTGFVISPAISISSQSTPAPSIEIASMIVRYQVGEPL